MKKPTLGTALAATAAIAFSTAPVTTSFAAEDANAQVQCFGVNGCKGHSACKTASNACAGHNSCKGKGFEMKTLAECKKAGGNTSET